MRKLKIQINNQDYIKIILKKNPNISSGRKKYKEHYIRILKNILITKEYSLILKKNLTDKIFRKNKFVKDKKHLIMLS